jgi:hypothetical protein
LEKLIEQILLVQLSDQPVLHNLSAVIDQQVHNGFRNAISNGFSGDIEIGCDEGAFGIRKIYVNTGMFNGRVLFAREEARPDCDLG